MPLARYVAVAVLVACAVSSATATQVRAEPTGPELERAIQAAAAELSAVVEEYNGLREDLRVTVAQAEVLARQVAPLERRVDQLQERIGVIATTAYKTAGVTDLNLVLGASTGQDFIRRLDVLDHLVRQRQAEIATLHGARDQYLAARRTLEALAGQQRDQEHDLAARKARIEADMARLRALRVQAYGIGERTVRGNPRDGFVPVVPAGALGAVVTFAVAQLGKRYRFAADGPDEYDCSGLVVAAFRGIGVSLPHSSRQQWARAKHITRAELRPGDLVFYYADIHHVAIYVGLGRVIHAPQFGEPVRIDSVDSAPVHGFGRVT